MKCFLCSAGDIESGEFPTVQDLTEHLMTHDTHNLAFAYADLLFILDERRIKKEDNNNN